MSVSTFFWRSRRPRSRETQPGSRANLREKPRRLLTSTLTVTMNALPKFHRHHEIRRIRGDLERDSFPRLQMFLLVTLTGASGFVASYVLLHAGFVEMWLRYLASFGVAYLIDVPISVVALAKNTSR